MMKIELDIAEVTKAVSAYLAATFTVNVNISELKVVAGREANGARIEVSVDTGSKIAVVDSCCGGTEIKVPASLEPVDEEEEIDNIGDVAYVDTEPVELLPEPKSETVAPLVEQELKPIPGSFFANRREETEN